MKYWKDIKLGFRNITLEPVFFLFCVALGLSMISTSNLYIMKACKVNLGYNDTICDNIYSHKEVQKKTQKYVAEIQSYNGLLQSAPGVIITLFAGPLSDKFGRKPVILFSLFGYFILQVVFLINSIWFYELSVEYLLFECLQDMMGGSICYYMACYSYMADITTKENRTKRLSILDSFMPIGFGLSVNVGTFLRKHHGFVTVYSVSTAVMALALLYSAIFIKEERPGARDGGKDQKKRDAKDHGEGDDKDYGEKGGSQDHGDKREQQKLSVEENKANIKAERNGDNFKIDKSKKQQIEPLQGFCFKFRELVLSGFKTIFRRRPYGGRYLVLGLVFVFVSSKAIDGGASVPSYMFSRIQYQLDDITRGYFSTYYTVVMYFGQVAVVPILSGKFHLRDTTIVILGMSLSTFANIFYMVGSTIYLIPFIYTLHILHNTITTTCRSNLSKLMNNNELGKAFSILGILQALLPMATKPMFGFIYKATVDSFPGTYLIVAIIGYTVIIVVLTIVHVGQKKMEPKII